MEEVKKLKQRINELEYRLGILKKFIDRESSLFLKYDESIMNVLKIEAKRDLNAKGIGIGKGQERYGAKLYLKP